MSIEHFSTEQVKARTLKHSMLDDFFDVAEDCNTSFDSPCLKPLKQSQNEVFQLFAVKKVIWLTDEVVWVVIMNKVFESIIESFSPWQSLWVSSNLFQSVSSPCSRHIVSGKISNNRTWLFYEKMNVGFCGGRGSMPKLSQSQLSQFLTGRRKLLWELLPWELWPETGGTMKFIIIVTCSSSWRRLMAINRHWNRSIQNHLALIFRLYVFPNLAPIFHMRNFLLTNIPCVLIAFIFVILAGDMEILAYFFGPIGILLGINLLLFASTARQLTCGLWKRDDVKSTTER